jgi:hypothetical protein
MNTNQLHTANVDGVLLRDFAELLLPIVVGWDGEYRPELLEDEELLAAVYDHIERAYSAGFMAGESVPHG